MWNLLGIWKCWNWCQNILKGMSECHLIQTFAHSKINAKFGPVYSWLCSSSFIWHASQKKRSEKVPVTFSSFFLNLQDISGAVAGYEVPPPQNILKLPVVRQAGRFGSATLFWEAIASTATFEDFTPSFGNLTFADGQVCTCWHFPVSGLLV